MKPIETQTILITGATDGLGKAVAQVLAKQGATLLLHGRNQTRGEETIRSIRQKTGNDRLTYYQADFSSLAEVNQLATRIEAEHQHLDSLVNNAGIGAGKRGDCRELSQDGYELRFAVNYLAPFLLTNRLLNLLIKSAPARIVTVASVGQEAINFDNVMLKQGYSGVRAYSQSKLAEIMMTFDLAEKLHNRQVTANCLHPATLMPTKMTIEAFGSGIATVEEGVNATVRLITDSQFNQVTGRYFNGTQESHADAQAYSKSARQQLWELSEHLCGLKAIT